MIPVSIDAVAADIVQPFAPWPHETYTFTGGCGAKFKNLGSGPTMGRESGLMGRHPAQRALSPAHFSDGRTCRALDSSVCLTFARVSSETSTGTTDRQTDKTDALAR
jgi:hypothetical protein